MGLLPNANMSDPAVVLFQAADIQKALARIAREIVRTNPNSHEVVLVGIQRGGVHLAKRLSRLLHQRWKCLVPVGSLDVSMHRDDLSRRLPPNVYPTVIPFDIDGRTVILVDDVLFKGRTVRAAMDALNDFGRPQRIQLAVLVDRGHRELPIKADFVGREVETTLGDRVNVRLTEDGDEEGVILEKNGVAT
jgi:pyrimidine operon attenuation protein / uracil phosphoribosyltransferase